MHPLAFVGVTALFFSSFVSASLYRRDNCTYPRQKGKDYDYSGFTCNQTERAEAVVEMFRFAWDGYYKYAFPNDDLLPLSNSFSNSRSGWGLIAVSPSQPLARCSGSVSSRF